MTDETETRLIVQEDAIAKGAVVQAVQPPATSQWTQFSNYDQALAFAKRICDTELVPNGYRKRPDAIVAAMAYGAELGIKPMQAIKSIVVINGLPSIYGDTLLALVSNHPSFISCDEERSGSGDDYGATCTIKRRNEWGNVNTTTQRFTWRDAIRARLAGKSGPWSQYPQRMLQMRARAFCIRDAFPDVIMGISMAEEAMDTPPPPPLDGAKVSSIGDDNVIEGEVVPAGDAGKEPHPFPAELDSHAPKPNDKGLRGQSDRLAQRGKGGQGKGGNKGSADPAPPDAGGPPAGADQEPPDDGAPPHGDAPPAAQPDPHLEAAREFEREQRAERAGRRGGKGGDIPKEVLPGEDGMTGPERARKRAADMRAEEAKKKKQQGDIMGAATRDQGLGSE